MLQVGCFVPGPQPDPGLQLHHLAGTETASSQRVAGVLHELRRQNPRAVQGAFAAHQHRNLWEEVSRMQLLLPHCKRLTLQNVSFGGFALGTDMMFSNSRACAAYAGDAPESLVVPRYHSVQACKTGAKLCLRCQSLKVGSVVVALAG